MMTLENVSGWLRYLGALRCKLRTWGETGSGERGGGETGSRVGVRRGALPRITPPKAFCVSYFCLAL